MGHGLIGGRLGDNKDNANAALDANVELANKYAKGVGKLGYGNYMANSAYANQAQQNANNLDLQTQEAIKASNEAYDDSKTQAQDDVANMGYTAGSNNVYTDTSASYDAQKAQTAEQIQNDANMQQYKANQQALNQAGGFTNTGYNNAMYAGNSAYGAKSGANNAMAAYAQQRANNKMGLFGAGVGATGTAMSGK